MRESDSSLYITVGHSTHASVIPYMINQIFRTKRGGRPRPYGSANGEYKNK